MSVKVKLFGEYVDYKDFSIFDAFSVSDEEYININELDSDGLKELLNDYFSSHFYKDKIIILIKWLLKNKIIKQLDLENEKLIIYPQINISKINYYSVDAFYFKKLDKIYFLSKKPINEYYENLLRDLITIIYKREFYNLGKENIKKIEKFIQTLFKQKNCFSNYISKKLFKLFSYENLIYIDYIDNYDCFLSKFLLKMNYISKEDLIKLKEKYQDNICDKLYNKFVKNSKEKFIKDLLNKYFKTFNNLLEYLEEFDEKYYNVKNSIIDLFLQYKIFFDNDCLLSILKKEFKEKDILRIKQLDKFNNYYIYEFIS